MSLRSRLLVSVGAVALVALLVTDVAIYSSLRAFFYDRLDASLATAARSISALALQPSETTSSDPPAAAKVPTTEPFCPFIEEHIAPATFVAVYRRDGSPVAHQRCLALVSPERSYAPLLPAGIGGVLAGRRGGATASFNAPSTVAEGPEFRVLVLALAEPVPGELVVASSLHSTDAALERLTLIELLVSLAALAVASLLGGELVRRGMRPLRDVQRTAETIAEGDLSHRVPERNPRTEVGAVGAALNFMLGRIEEAFAQREATEDALRSSQEQLRRFVADASHELRTPIAAVSAYVELFERRKLPRDEDLERTMAGIARETARMGHLVEDLLLLARLDEGRPLERHRVELVGLVAEAIETARTVGPGWPIRLEAAEVVEVVGDPLRLRQVVDNLLANIRAHTVEGTAGVVRVAREDASAVLEVRDFGFGLPPEQAGKVFDRFFRADQSRSRTSGGAGLGLAIVASIAAAHHGDVRYTPTPGGGATFTLRLPLASDEVEPSSKAGTPAMPGEAGAVLATRKPQGSEP